MDKKIGYKLRVVAVLLCFSLGLINSTVYADDALTKEDIFGEDNVDAFGELGGEGGATNNSGSGSSQSENQHVSENAIASSEYRIRVGLIEPSASLSSCDISFDAPFGIYLPSDKKTYSFKAPLYTFLQGSSYQLKRVKGMCELSNYTASSINEFNQANYNGYVPMVVNPRAGVPAGLRLVNLNTAFQANAKAWQDSSIEKVDAVCAYKDGKIEFMIANSFAVIKSVEDKPFLFYNKSYRGGISLFRSYDNPEDFFPINDLAIEDYLYGVVPMEMPTNWHKEAVKAQAVCARTYALSSLGNFSKGDYDVAPTVLSQVYGGMNGETANGRAAVDDTRHEELYYGDKRVQAFFHSNNGGFCASSEDVFSTKLPYFRAKLDPYSLKITKPWHYEVDKKVLKTNLQARDINIGDIVNLEIIEMTPSKIVKKIRIYGTNGTTDVGAGRLIGLLGAGNIKSKYFKIVGDKSTLDAELHKKTSVGEVDVLTADGIKKEKLEELLFVGVDGSVKEVKDEFVLTSDGVSKLSDGSKEMPADSTVSSGEKGDGLAYEGGKVGQKGLVIIGYGWGHNIGMSQWGAKVMADEGKTYQDILKFYYEGTEIRKN